MTAEAGALDADEAAELSGHSKRETGPAPAAAAGQPEVDAENPWLGLASYTEETRAYFHGRDGEIAELSRRVQRKLLTVLFGQSGLGKTSILRAGIVPRLRPAGYCPVYVRLDYSPESPPPAEQIKEAIFRATHALGEWSQPGIAEEGESLWEFLHHRDDVLKDSRGKTVIPLLIFDQFEEIFTLAQSDDAGKARAALFLEELADLVENRPPKALEAKLEHDDTKSERFDFTRADYRILIALREDYLAHLEGVKGAMPSITQNRMRLAPMTGQQALSAVMTPGGKLVSQEVAESIVRFIAGGSEIANAEVEPSLLSLICRELNNTRIAHGRGEISVDLLAGSNETILAEFYERALADQPPAVRRFIEDEMLTDSGYRESLAEERVRKAFKGAGAEVGALAKLVDRRLLRIEDRLDLRRVELTHDVLCNVVAASRDLRHEREARDEAERQLAAQKAREVATHKALVRARQIAAGCAVLAIGAVGSAIFGYQSMKRAQGAEAQALQVRAMAESARGESEKLIVYLLDDFYLELEPIGRLDVVADLAKRALAYYKELPAALRTAQTERNRALALVRYGAVLGAQGRGDEADVPLAEAVKVLGGLQGGGDTSEATTLGVAKSKDMQARVLTARGKFSEAIRLWEESLKLLRPLAEAPAPSRAVLRAEGEIRIRHGWSLVRAGDVGVNATLERAQAIFRKLGALELSDPSVSVAYAEAGVWLGEALDAQGRRVEGRKVLEEVVQISSRVLDARPGHMKALRTRSNASGMLGAIEFDELRSAPALALHRENEKGWETLVKMDSSVSSAHNNLAVARGASADALFSLGRVEESIRKRGQVVTLAQNVPMDGFLALNLAYWNSELAVAQANFEGFDKARSTLATAREFNTLARKQSSSAQRAMFLEGTELVGAQALLTGGEYPEFQSRVEAAMGRLRAIQPEGKLQHDLKNRILGSGHALIARAKYRAGDYPSAEAAAREALDLWSRMTTRSLRDELRLNELRTELAMCVARQGRLKEADELIQPVLGFHRKLQQRRVDDKVQQVLLSKALFASSLAAPHDRTAQLAEAATIMDGLSPEMKRWKAHALLRDEIAAEQKKRL